MTLTQFAIPSLPFGDLGMMIVSSLDLHFTGILYFTQVFLSDDEWFVRLGCPLQTVI